MTTTPTSLPNILQLTNVEQDERFYLKKLDDGTTLYAPSWTHVLSATWPSSFSLDRWRGDVGNTRADEIMYEAAEEGSFVHDACERLLKGEWIASSSVRDVFPRGRALKPLRCIQSFVDFCAEFNPDPIALESVTWLDDPAVAGTMDFLGLINAPVKKGRTIGGDPDNRVYALLDWKSSKGIYDNHKAQVAGYCLSEERNGRPPDVVGIVHLGNYTAKRWSFVDVTPELPDWIVKAELAVRTYHLHHPDARPSDEQFPEVFVLPVEEAPEPTTL